MAIPSGDIECRFVRGGWGSAVTHTSALSTLGKYWGGAFPITTCGQPPTPEHVPRASIEYSTGGGLRLCPGWP